MSISDETRLVFDRGADGARHEHRGVALIAPRDASIVSIEHDRGPKKDRVDRATLALVPAGLVYRVRALSPTIDVATLVIGRRAFRDACHEYAGQITDARFTALIATPRILPRTRWVDELIHRFVFERTVCKRADSPAALFLETELAKEIFFLSKEHEDRRTRASVVHEESDLVRRARSFIDGNLSAEIRVSDVAKRCHSSESTVLRAFARELGCTPMRYARTQRLEAALLLLQSGRYQVGEVAERVGYTNLPAFTAAFHKHFGTPPSAMRNRGAKDVPPEGAGARRDRRSI